MRASIVVPVYNEEAAVETCYKRLTKVFSELPSCDYELIFTDNRSSDRTFELLSQLHATDSRVRVFKFSKNFGYQRSILEGYRRACGDFAIQVDCDLQDPPELIPIFIRHWQEGAKVVYGVRRKRKESFGLEMARKAFYRLVTFLSGGCVPPDAGDFRLVDRVILDQLKTYNDESPYLRGRISELGFLQTGVPYDRDSRMSGTSKFSFFHLVALAVDGIVSHSIAPLRIATFIGLIMFLFTGFLALYYFGGKIVMGPAWPAGFTTLTLLLLLAISLNSLFFGIIGEYIARIYRQLKKNEQVIVDIALDSAPFSSPK